MRTINHHFKRISILFFFISASFYAQSDMPFVSVTTNHWNMSLDDFSMQEWKEVESEFHQKVTMKNEYILSATTLLHHFTYDNSEVISVTVYPTWNAIEQATARDNELIMEAWPDKDAREAFFKKQSKFYSNEHSDEIYRAFPGAKQLEDADSPLIYYVRTSHFSFPEDGSNQEFLELHTAFNEAVTYNNEYYKAYYPEVHFYGADRSEFIEVFVTTTLADLEKGLAKQGELFRASWDTEQKRTEFNDKFNNYFTGVHRDRIFSSVPELYKAPPKTEN